jgi:hypothetical protein
MNVELGCKSFNLTLRVFLGILFNVRCWQSRMRIIALTSLRSFAKASGVKFGCGSERHRCAKTAEPRTLLNTDSYLIEIILSSQSISPASCGCGFIATFSVSQGKSGPPSPLQPQTQQISLVSSCFPGQPDPLSRGLPPRLAGNYSPQCAFTPPLPRLGRWRWVYRDETQNQLIVIVVAQAGPLQQLCNA